MADLNDEWTNFVVVGRDDVLDFNEDNILPQSPETIAKIVAWLRPTEYNSKDSEYQKHLSSRLMGTGTWVSASDTYKQWHDGDEHGLLWVRGVPGSGKSVLAASIINQLSQEQVPVLYFFFRQIIDANHDSNAALRDWLAQALPFSPSLQLQIKAYLGGNDRKKKHQSPTEARKLESLSISDLWQHLRTALSHLPKAYIIVDALDEMNQGDATNEFLQALNGLSQWRPSQIKVLITSRPVASVERALRMEKILRLRLDETRIDSDIALYVKSRLIASSVPREHHQAIQAAVPGKANGLFLYAKLAMDAFLKDDAVIEEVLRVLPSNLNVMYSQLLREHAAKTETPLELQLLIMQAITHSTRPLRLIEMADMIATTSPANIEDLKAAKNIVRSACGPLLEVLPDETLCVVHHSLTEFLNGLTRSHSQDYPILMGGPTHSCLAIICLSYLQSGCLSRVADTPSEDPMVLIWRGEQPQEQLLAPFTKYAAANWYIHAKKTSFYEDDQSEINDMIDKFAAHADFQKWARLAGLRPGTDTVTLLIAAVSLGLTAYIKLLVSRSNVSLQDGAPICLAAEKGFTEIVEILLRSGADVSQYNVEGYTALHLAAKNNHANVISVLLQAGCDVNMPTKIKEQGFDRSYGRMRQHTSLWYACNYGHIEAVTVMLPYIKTHDVINDALSRAVESHKSDVVEKLLEHPIVDVHGSPCKSLLNTACSYRDLQTIKILLAAGVDPNHSEGQSPNDIPTSRKSPSNLHALSAFDYGKRRSTDRRIIDPDITKQCFALLIKAGANVNQTDSRGDTPLHVAHDPAAARALLLAGADVNQPNDREETPAHTCYHSDILRVLVEIGNADLERTDSSGLTPLQFALDSSKNRWFADDKPFVLLDLGARGSIVDKEGNTAIHYAIGRYEPMFGEQLTELVHRLCEAGAGINLRNNKGEAPIHLTSVEVHISKQSPFHALVNAGADLTPRDDTSSTPLFNWIGRSILYAKESDLPQVDDILKRCGARYDITDDKGRTLLHAAVVSDRGPQLNWMDGWRWPFQFLIKNGVDPNATDIEGNTLWHEMVPGMAKSHCEVRCGSPEIFTELLRLGVSPQQPNKSGQTPLHILSSLWPDAVSVTKRWYGVGLDASHSGQTTVFDIVLGYCQPNVDCVDRDGITPLHLASTFSEYQTRRLLEAGAHPSQANMEGLNAFHISARSRMPNIVGIILTHLRSSSDSTLLDTINAKDALGRTPLYYACNSGSFEIAKMLIDAGAEVDSVEYESSPWKGCADYEREVKSWSQYNQPYLQSEGAGGVLLTDRLSSKKQTGHYNVDRIGELFTLLALHTKTETDFIDLAINDAAEQDADHTVDLLLRARTLIKSTEKSSLSTKVRESINRRQAVREASNEPCRKCSRVHEGSTIVDYHDLPETLCPEDQVKVHTGRLYGKTILHELVFTGFASVLSRILMLENVQKLEDRAWNEEQEALLEKSRGHVEKGMIEPLLLSACRRTTPNMDVIRVLVEHVGINVNAQAYKPDKSTWNGNMTNDLDAKGESALHVLVRGEHWWQVAQALPYLLERGINVELKDSKQMTPLSAALKRCGWLNFNKKAVELLVKYGADVNSVDGDGNSCLARALTDRDMTQLLLDHGAKVTHDVFKQVFHLEDVELLRLLLSRGADPNVRPVSGWKVMRYEPPEEKAGGFHDEFYPLHNLVESLSPCTNITDQSEQREMVRLLLDHGADPCAEYDGTTILHEVICAGEIADPLLATPISSLDLEVRNSTGETPLLLACHPAIGRDTSEDNAEGRTIINLLLLRGADVRATDNNGTNVLHHFAKGGVGAGKCEDFETIIASAPELINQVDNAGNTPLHLAMGRAPYTSRHIDLFLSNGGDIHAVDAEGNTMLHLLFKGTWKVSTEGVVKGKLLDIFRRLLSMGADINACNYANETPIFSFFRNGKVDVERPPEPMLTLKELNERKYEPPRIWEEPVYDTFTEVGLNWKALNGEGQNLLHIVAAVNDPYLRGAKRFKTLIEMGLDPGMEDQAQRTPVDVAADLGNKDVLELFSDK